jgi:hypothetical protein
MFSSRPTTRRLVGFAAALAVAIGTPVAGAGVDRGIGVPPSKSQHVEPYSDALDRYLRNNRPETYPDALGRFLANELRSRQAVTRQVDGYQPQLRARRGAETRSNDGLSWTAAVISAALALAFIGSFVTTRRLRVTLRNV